MTAVAEKTKAKIAEPEIPEITIEGVKVNEMGQAWRTVLVRCPEGMTQDDLRSPKIWKRVQGSRLYCLQKLDHLLIVAADESWYARAVVSFATNSEAHLVIEKVGTFKAVGSGLWSDGTLCVKFYDGAYYVHRISDDARVVGVGYQTEGQAIGAARAWYPKAVA